MIRYLKFVEVLHLLENERCFSLIFNFNFMSKNKENCDPTSLKKWIAIIIAVLSALAGALGEQATGFIGKIF